MKNADLAQLPADFGVMDYMTSQQDDYRNPYPSVAKPVSVPYDFHDVLASKGNNFAKTPFMFWHLHRLGLLYE